MPDEFDKMVNRIRKDNPTRRVYYVRGEIKANPKPSTSQDEKIQLAALNKI